MLKVFPETDDFIAIAFSHLKNSQGHENHLTYSTLQ